MNNQEAIKRVKTIKNWGGMTIPVAMRDIEALDMAIKALEEQERQTGEWIFDAEHSFTIDLYKCSVCGSGGHVHFKYCPRCGAKIKEAENDKRRSN